MEVINFEVQISTIEKSINSVRNELEFLKSEKRSVQKRGKNKQHSASRE
jgi:hypothetical protein